MSEAKNGHKKEPLYDDATRMGVQKIAEETGKGVEEVLRQAIEDNLRKHAETSTTTLTPENVAESAENFDKAYHKLLSRIKREKKKPR